MKMEEELMEAPPRLETPMREDPGSPDSSPSTGGDRWKLLQISGTYRAACFICWKTPMVLQDKRRSRWSWRGQDAPASRGGGDGQNFFPQHLAHFLVTVFIRWWEGLCNVILFIFISITSPWMSSDVHCSTTWNNMCFDGNDFSETMHSEQNGRFPCNLLQILT